MPGSHWMIVMSPENFEITRDRGFDVVGLKSRHRKKAERMALGDRVLFYVAGCRVFPLTATVSSTFFEDHTPIWVSTERRPDVAPWRVQVRPDVVLHWYEYLDARQIAPRMLYVKRWAPEDWPLAFQGQIHLLSSQDFALIEHEMRRTIDRRSRRRERPPHRPRLPASEQVASLGLMCGAMTRGPIVAASEPIRPGQAAVVDDPDDSAIISPRSPAGR